MSNPHQPDLRPFLGYVVAELEYLLANDVSDEPDLLAAAGALVVIRRYLEHAIANS